jgi:imidazolonepropionase-like amidohydrolase
VGPRREWRGKAREEHDAIGAWITPGLVDCHTHLVYAGNRAHEFELRLKGASYEEIARAGGGIVSTVKATRAASRKSFSEFLKRDFNRGSRKVPRRSRSSRATASTADTSCACCARHAGSVKR